MDFLCLNCGHININNKTLRCDNCNNENDFKQQKKLTEYASCAVHYGYEYRIEYERQVSEKGEISVKYSLLNPSTYLEWIAVASLSGVVGNMVYDLVKHVAKQVYEKLTAKKEAGQLTHEEQNALTIVSDNATLNKFTVYIQSYYKGMPKIDKKVEWGILEEEIVHSITDGEVNKMEQIMKEVENGKDIKEAFGELFLEGAKKAAQKRREKPKLEELNATLKELKKDIKQLKKEKKKKK